MEVSRWGWQARLGTPASCNAPLTRSGELVVIGGWGLDTGEDLADLENGFVWYAAAYSQQKGLSYRNWREAGVPVDALTRAGILEFNGRDSG